jgi:hypothetical protein
MIPRTTVASTPPVKRMSAVPCLIDRNAFPIASEEEVHPVEMTCEVHRDLGGEGPDRAGGNRVHRSLLDLIGVIEVIHPLGELDRATAASEDHAERAALRQ